MNFRDELTKPAWALLVVTVAFEAVRAGAGTFRALIDLPARAQLGAVAFADLSRATDLSTRGVSFYAIYGVGGALLTIAAWIVARRTHAPRYLIRCTAISAACSIAVLLLTTQAAPLMWRAGEETDPAVLESLFDRFALWTYLRVALVDLSFASVLTALAWAARPPSRGET